MEPYEQAEQREAEWDNFVEDLPVCKLCGHSVYPGNHYHETRNGVVCSGCKIELDDNERILEDC